MTLKILFFPIALFMAFMVTIFFTKPEWDIYQTKQAELSELTRELDDLKGGYASIKNVAKKFGTLNSDQVSLVTNAIPYDESNDDFLAEIHKSAERSGVFVVATKVKNTVSSRNKERDLEKSSQNAPERKGTTIMVAVMGSYVDIAEFVKEVDSHNRLTVPKEILIVSQDKETVSLAEEGGATPQTGSVVKCEVTFDFFDKAKNDKLQIASLIRAKDPVIKSLLSGQFKLATIEKYQDSITREVFRPVGAGSAGKDDIFAR